MHDTTHVGDDDGPATRPFAVRHLSRYIMVNAGGLWVASFALVIVFFTGVRTYELAFQFCVLTGGAVLISGAAFAARHNYIGLAVIGILVVDWGVSFAVTWESPYAVSITMLSTLIPMVVILGTVSQSTARLLAIPLVIVATALIGLAFASNGGPHFDYRESTIQGFLLFAFTPLTMGIVVIAVDAHLTRVYRAAVEVQRSRERLAEASMQARRLIERDLHDGAQQQLASIAVELGRATRLLDRDPAQAREVMTDLDGQLGKAIRELRDLARGIYPALLEERGLGPALTAAARRAQTPTTVTEHGVGRYPAAVEAAVYFCCVEAVHNADRHANATSIAVTIDGAIGQAGPTLTFSVIDDGRGFDTAAVRDSSGMTGMRDRIKAARGVLRISSRVGHGTTVSGHFLPDALADSGQHHARR